MAEKYFFTLNAASRKERKGLAVRLTAKEILSVAIRMVAKGEIAGRNVNDETGEITVLVGVFREIAERVKRFRANLAAAWARYYNTDAYVTALYKGHKNRRLDLDRARDLFGQAKRMLAHRNANVLDDFGPVGGKLAEVRNAADNAVSSALIRVVWAIAHKLGCQGEAKRFELRLDFVTPKSRREGLELAVAILQERQRSGEKRDHQLAGTTLEDIVLERAESEPEGKAADRRQMQADRATRPTVGAVAKAKRKAKRQPRKRGQTGRFADSPRTTKLVNLDVCPNILRRPTPEMKAAAEQQRKLARVTSTRGAAVPGTRKKSASSKA